MNELNQLQKHLYSKNVNLPGKTLEKAIYLPEDEYMSKEFRDQPYPDIKDHLYVNPFPAPKKGGKKKKKK